MNNLKNSVRLTGRLGADPSLKNFANGTKLLQATMATTERYQSGSDWKEETQWHRLVFWKELAERAEKHLEKGILLTVQGKLVYRSYPVNGVTRYITEIVVQQFLPLEKRKTTEAVASAAITEDADLPF